MNLTPSTFVEQVRFAEINLSTGIRMHYAEFGDRAGTPIVFLHGTTDSWYSFSPVLEYLPTRYHIYMLDQRGHGNSSRPQNGYAMSDFADDAVAFLQAMDLQRVTLIGHSMGSIIAQHVAVKAPELLDRLVLAGSTTNPYTHDLWEYMTAVVDTLTDPVPEEVAREFQFSTISNPLPESFVNGVITESLKLPARVWQGAFHGILTDHVVVPSLEQILMPTLLLYGEKDTIWSLAEQEALLSRIPNAELRVYPQTGHALHWEQPEQFARDIQAFIDRTL
jgi:non-heme chloroperoxidase